jgi:TonB-dependent SusC/RagA subfamily outer membrane receptor
MILLLAGLGGIQSLAQERVVYGRLTAFNKYPLQNIQVSSRKAKTTVLSDSTGTFSIVCKEKDVIKITSKTFQGTTRKVNSGTDSLNINLIFVDNPANRELAVGYGYMKADDLSYAVTHLDHENNGFCNYNDIMDLIRGQVAGAQVDGDCVVIRGPSSINMNICALYVVDGAITNNIDWINPCEVKTIDVLKDASTSIYGSRGANGVILIGLRK